MAKEYQPIFIMPEGTQRSSGKTAQRNNIMAAKLVAETVRTTLGPKGMDKMIVDPLGDITITNDGVTILQEMQIEHPAAKMLVEVAKTQEDEVGDGTTTAVVLAGELLKNAEQLLEKDIHPTIIAKGYRIAEGIAQKILNNISEPVTEKNTELLRQIAITAMTGKGAEHARDILADITVKGILKIMEKEGHKIFIDKNNIKVEKKVGGSVDDSILIEGVVLDKEKVHSEMPRYVRNARIALLDVALEIRNTEIDAKIQITDPNQIQQFLDVEERMIRDMVEKIIRSGANVVFCQKGIDDLAQHYLAKNGIYACRRVKKSDIDQLAKATGAKIVMNLDDLSANDLGNAGLVEEKKFGEESMTYVQNCLNTKSVTLLIRGGTEHIVAEVERAIDDSIGDLTAALMSGKVVAGAGAAETEVARNLRLFANSLSGREQLAVLAFADSIEVIPRTLAENAGLDPIDVLMDLKAAHDKGKKWAGIDVFSGEVIDAWKAGVLEPLKIKTQAVSSAAEVAEMILRIDDVIAGGASDKQKPMPNDIGGMM
jgi:thermosome